MSDGRHVVMGLIFYPRGGSAQVIKYLVPALGRVGWSSHVVCGSLGGVEERTNAKHFFAEIPISGADYGPAIEAFEQGRDPIASAEFPIHPSFEDREGVPDRVFAAVRPELGDRLVDAWTPVMAAAVRDRPPAIFHLHHLTPLQEAATRVAPHIPLVTHLHGTEMKMIDRIDRLGAVANALGTDLAGMADADAADALPDASGLPAPEQELFVETRWGQFRHGDHWTARLRAVAQSSDRFIVISPHDRSEATRLLGVDPDRVTWIPNGVDTELFNHRELSLDQRLGAWRRWLVDEPCGWDESGEVGSLGYSEAHLQHFIDAGGGPAPVLLFVGRFLDFKRVPMLVRAYARARDRFDRPAPLVVWGGFPGEWEGEHPHSVAREVGEEGIFFVGWRGHTELVEGLACSDVMVAPSHNEPFGQVFLEAMACAVPVIATRTGGPLSFVNTEANAPNGWMVEPDDEGALADAIVAAVNNDEDRVRRADNGYAQVRAEYSWSGLAHRFTAVYDAALQDR